MLNITEKIQKVTIENVEALDNKGVDYLKLIGNIFNNWMISRTIWLSTYY